MSAVVTDPGVSKKTPAEEKKYFPLRKRISHVFEFTFLMLIFGIINLFPFSALHSVAACMRVLFYPILGSARRRIRTHVTEILGITDEKELKKVLSLKVIPADNGGALSGLKPRKKAEVRFAIGINTRNLHTLECDPHIAERLYTMIPKDRVVVVESGLKSYQDILFLKVFGVNAVLVGGSILAAADMKMFIQDLMGW